MSLKVRRNCLTNMIVNLVIEVILKTIDNRMNFMLLRNFKIIHLSVGWILYMLTLMLKMNQLLNLCHKKQNKAVTSHKVQIYHQC